MNEQNERDEQYTHDLRQVISEDFTFTKRQLGIVLILVGILGFVGIIGIDIVDFGREGGIGPAQRAALILMVFVAIFGATLIPLGDDPA